MTQLALFQNGTLDQLLDEAETPVARMRLFSEGIRVNNRLFAPDEVIGDKACLACGNCVDACPVVRENYRFVFVQNQRTSMALENMVGEACRRCYRCVEGCPQVDKPVKEYVAAFRRGEKIVHFLTAGIILLLAMSGITLLHYTNQLPVLEVLLLRWTHRILGLLLIVMPVVYLILDKRHMARFLKKVFVWRSSDWEWFVALVRHLKNNRKHPMPPRVQFNPGQKAWYLYIIAVIFPVLGITGAIQWAGLDFGLIKVPALSASMLVHMIFALTTDLLIFLHLYLKYFRNWIILVFDIVRSYVIRGHLLYPALYDSSHTFPKRAVK